MTKRLHSKRKPYLQSGVDLWGKANLFWQSSDRLKTGPGQQKRNHQTSERVMKLPISSYVDRLVQCGFVTPKCSEEIKVSFAEPKYASLLKEKQKLRRFYANITEKQFKQIYSQATRMQGEVTANFLSLIEKRLDTILYRSNLAVSFFQARQMINHRHILLNGTVCNVASHQLQKGDLVQIRPSFYSASCQTLNPSFLQDTSHLQVDYLTFSCVFLQTPTLKEISFPFEIDLEKVVRYYR
uniref:Ribosomal protein S4 n=1 Tax=Jakoba libera TaxID=143017 RepID=M4QL46_JAKLI|nr:ribosomal protein S4 [Jakoba libera]AGH24178.1 ribosomal protein S4 [Jakoba libera]